MKTTKIFAVCNFITIVFSVLLLLASSSKILRAEQGASVFSRPRFVFLEMGVETLPKFRTLERRFRDRVLRSSPGAQVEAYRVTSPTRYYEFLIQMGRSRLNPIHGLLVHSHGNQDGLQMCSGDGTTNLCQPVPVFKLAQSLRDAGVQFTNSGTRVLFSGCNLVERGQSNLHQRVLNGLGITQGWVYLNYTFSVPTVDEFSIRDDVSAAGVVGMGVVAGLLGYFPVPTVLVGSVLMVAESLVFNRGMLVYRSTTTDLTLRTTYDAAREKFFEGL